MLDSVDSPRSHWLLKTPMHSLFLNTLSRHYQNAFLIMTHRRLDEVLPSFCSLILAYGSDFYDTDDNENRTMLTAQAIQTTEHMIDNIVKFRTQDHLRQENSSCTVFDLQYTDLMAQPIISVHQIYDHFFSKTIQQLMSAMSIGISFV